MQLHEYQAKRLFDVAGIKVQTGLLARTAKEAARAIAKLTPPLVVKAQVHAGGRGKAGAIKFAQTAEEAQRAAEDILGMTLRTKQTGQAGLVVKSVLIVEASDIDSELYLSIVTDRASRGPMLIASRAGGVDIEETAERDPDAILKFEIDPVRGLTDHACRRVHFFWSNGTFGMKDTAALLKGVYDVYMRSDATMVEINPVVVTPEHELLALDAKVATDDNARFRHPEWEAWAKGHDRDAREVEAEQHGLNYIKLPDGTIGCMVNGAGLAMATMDVIKNHGAAPANFLDVGGGADVEAVTAAFRILAADSDVKAILVNIFGGIMKCDIIAEGILAALGSVKLTVPLVVRLEGTNVEQGRRIIAESGLDCETAVDLSDAAEKAVAAAGA